MFKGKSQIFFLLANLSGDIVNRSAEYPTTKVSQGVLKQDNTQKGGANISVEEEK